MKRRKGVVRIDGVAVGILQEEDQGSSFSYLPEWLENPMAVPVSLTLPLKSEAYLSRSLHPFFQNLLPEGWLLELATKKLKVAKDDGFGLLLATCSDCIGAVEVVPANGGENVN